ncbi:oxaloacetate decarboxylase [Mailhella massiliensis]|uniref:2-methylisocitrate lyase n=1 Tax=Mailhella massiliensis TaxID=1903261 RepID=A0A921DSQ4_9BACT|nr:isocitrate lyase/phosphoenolpyruvate mutase family protein [Mailhella massiliensis]HJD98391.1 isocitrate lyase/phosphoenolpyruvate mutase family protein [Mailhella massiliensis]
MMTRNAQFRKRLAEKRIIVAPGAYDAMCAKIIEKQGFEALYMSGAGLSYSLLGKPDIGLLTQTEMAARAAYLSEAVELPIIADADTGFGNALNVARTVKEYERAGVSCIQLEDQVMPKRCGHMSGKALISAAEMCAKIRAACDARQDEDFCIMARTDAIAVEGYDRALERAFAYREAGADLLFVEAPRTEEMMRSLCAALPDCPMLANMVEGGRTPLFSASELEDMGFRVVIFPGAASRVIAFAVNALMEHLREKGGTADYLDRMYDFGRLNEILELEAIRRWEQAHAEGENTLAHRG